MREDENENCFLDLVMWKLKETLITNSWGGMYKYLTGGNSKGTSSRGCIDNILCESSCKGERRNGETVAEIHIVM